jgi:hypothetical protein
MALSYIRHDEEFLGTVKLTDGSEVLARMLVVEDTANQEVVFVSNPAKVHHTEKTIEGKSAQIVALKKWMVFSDEDFYIIPEQQVISIAPQSAEAKMMYRMFVRQEFDHEEIDSDDSSVEVNESMGLLGKVDQVRSKLEDLFNN